jgi:hypothetical protein
VTGLTESGNYPTTPNAFDTSFNGALYFFFFKYDAFVTKLNASGSALDYSTFLGGWGTDRGFSIAVREGKAYVTGDTSSSNLPTTRGAFDNTINGGRDAFVTKLPTG